MPDYTDNVIAVIIPQVNVNDDEVTLIGWHVENGGQVAEGQPLCEIETSKSTGDVPSPAAGVFRQAAEVGQFVAVGQVIGHIGPSMQAIEDHLARQASSAKTPSTSTPTSRHPIDATAGAIALAHEHGIDITRVPAAGKIRRADVEQFLAQHPEVRKTGARVSAATGDDKLPTSLESLVIDEGDLPDHVWSIAQHLAATQQRLVTAHAAMDIGMERSVAWLDAQRRAGRMAGPIPLLLHAAATAANACPRLASFRLGRHVYRYQSLDIAFTARSPDGRLFAPVVRDAAAQTLEQLAAEVARLSMAVFRGQLDAGDCAGGAMTVSVLSDQPIRFHVGLQNAFQSALLTAGAIRDDLALHEGRPITRPTWTLVLSYDHGLMDGQDAAAALAAARAALENLNV
ncbi:MAG TPA: 2-oxo acid dehydrogenase subunit E2 [Phycisphaerae bacterium]|nr:2-oxo acid dehydrogenase subunit E2 [Phycisphaerae bacterium]